MTVRQIDVGGRRRNVRELGFEEDAERWNEYRLANGDRVRIKIVVHKIYRVLDADGQPAFTAEGDPEVVVRHQLQVSATSDMVPHAQEGDIQ